MFLIVLDLVAVNDNNPIQWNLSILPFLCLCETCPLTWRTGRKGRCRAHRVHWAPTPLILLKGWLWKYVPASLPSPFPLATGWSRHTKMKPPRWWVPFEHTLLQTGSGSCSSVLWRRWLPWKALNMGSSLYLQLGKWRSQRTQISWSRSTAPGCSSQSCSPLAPHLSWARSVWGGQ